MATLLQRLDAIQVHAANAAISASGANFTDVLVGFPAARGKCVRVFYGGERQVEHFDSNDRTLNSLMVGQVIVVRAYWPQADSGATQQRDNEGEMGAFVSAFRTNVLGDAQLGGAATDLNMTPFGASQAIVAGTEYTVLETEIVVDFDEYTLAP